MILCLSIQGGLPDKIMLTNRVTEAKEFEKDCLVEADFLKLTDDMTFAEQTRAFLDARDKYEDGGHEDIDYYIYYGLKSGQRYL